MKNSFKPSTRLAPLLAALAAACGAPVPAEQHAARAALAAPQAAALAPAVASLAGGHLAAADGTRVALHGFSWFGFNTGTGQLDGLWQGGEPLAGDFATVVHRQKLLGFNAVRLPFSFAQLNAPARQVATSCRLLAAGEVGASTLPAGSQADPAAAPALPADVARSPGMCNAYLPTGSQRQAYLWAVQFYLNNGFYVLADNHYREDTLAQDDQAAWVAGWAQLAADLYALPGAAGRVFLDLLNEPGQYGQGWEPSAGRAGVRALYLAAMDAVEARVPGAAIFFVEGTGQDTLGANWGDGYCTDPAKLAQLSLSDPRPFFTALAAKPYRGRLGLAPHVYGPAVTNATANYQGADLFARLSSSFGGFNRAGFAVPGQPSLILPVAIGEFGSKFEGDGDKAFMRDFALYLQAQGAGDDSRHQAIDNWFYWSWNADSGDTGGLVADDWKELQWQKIAYLNSLGLSPWYTTSPPTAASTSSSASTPRPSSTSPTPPATSAASAPAAPPASAPAPAAPSSATSTPSAPSPPAKTATAPQPAPSAPPKASPPSPQTATSTPNPAIWAPLPAAAAPPDGSIHVLVHRDSSWEAGFKRCFAVNLHITRPAGKTIEPPWSLEVVGPSFNSVTGAWNIHQVVAYPNRVEAVADGDWQHLSPTCGEVVVGLTYCVTAGQPEAITGVRVAGLQAQLQ